MMLVNDRYQVISAIEVDSTLQIYRVKDLAGGRLSSALCMVRDRRYSDLLYDHFVHNFLKYAALEHPNLVRARRFNTVKTIDKRIVEEKMYFFVYDYQMITGIKYCELSIAEKLSALQQIIMAVRYCHFNGVACGGIECDDMVLSRREDQTILARLNAIPMIIAKNNQALFGTLVKGKRAFLRDTVDLIKILRSLSIGMEQLSADARRRLFKSLDDIVCCAEPVECPVENLIEALEQSGLLSFPFSDKAYYETIHFDVSMISRNEELHLLTDSVEDSFADRSSIYGAFISGISGIGKTRLLRELFFLTRTSGRQAFIVELTANSRDPYRFLKQFFRQFFDMAAAPDKLVKKFSKDLIKVLPEFKHSFRVDAVNILLDQTERSSLNNRLLNFLIEIGHLLNPLLVIENIHYLNENEFLLLQMMLELRGHAPFYLVCSARNPAFEYKSYHRINPENLLQLNLNGLNENDVDQLLVKLFHCVDDIDCVNNAIKRLATGSPRSIEILLNHFITCGIIWVGDDRKWHCREFSLEDANYRQEIAHAYAETFAKIDVEMMLILQKISLFEEPVEVSLLKRLCQRHDDAFDRMLQQLIDEKLLFDERRSLVDYIGYVNAEIKRIIYEDIASQKKVEHHRQVVACYQSEGKCVSRDYLLHLIGAQLFEMALDAAMTLADEMEVLNQIDNAIEYHEQARQLAEQLSDYGAQIAVIKRIADIYYHRRNVQSAETNYWRLVDLAKRHKAPKAYVDARIKLIEIELGSGYTPYIVEQINDLAEYTRKIKYDKGYFDVQYFVFIYYLNNQDVAGAKRLLQSLNEVADASDDSYLRAKLYIMTGVLRDFERDYQAAFNAYQSALGYLRDRQHDHERALIENNLGVLTIEMYGDIKRSKQYFKSALNRLKRARIAIDRNNYLNNLGELMFIEGKWRQALITHRKALTISYELNDLAGVVATLPHLVETQIKLAQYNAAQRNIKKLLNLLQRYPGVVGGGFLERVYYAVSLFYIKVCDREAAAVYCDRLMQVKSDFCDHLSDYRERVHNLYCGYYLKGNRLDYKIDKAHISQLIAITNNEVERHLFGEALIDILLDMMSFDNRESVQKMYCYYQKIQLSSAADDLQFKERIIDCYIARSAPLEVFIDDELFHRLVDEDKWKIYIAIANSLALKGGYYRALRWYLEAIDGIQGLYLSLDPGVSEAYILQDALKKNLFDCINILMKKIDCTHTYTESMTVAAFLNIKPHHQIYKIEAFKRSIESTYAAKHGIALSTREDLLTALGSDSESNITIVLKYLTQLTLADYGFLMLIDSKQKIGDVFHVDCAAKLVDYRAILERYGYLSKARVFSGNKFEEVGLSGIKNCMLIPVYDDVQTTPLKTVNRRRRQVRSYRLPNALIVLAAYSRLNRLDAHSLATIAEIQSIIKLVIDNYQLYRSSTIDKLTGAYLRKQFEKIFSQNIEKCRRMNEPLAILMLDIDHFKAVNDAYGHRKGDEVLANVASIIGNSIRNEDALGRYGGEEFVVLLPTASRVKAFEIAERIRHNISQARFIDGEKGITISCGIAVFPQMGERQIELLEKADKALYASKRSGRNKTTVYAGERMAQEKPLHPLAGILTGSTLRDARVMKSIMSIVSFSVLDKTKSQKILFALSAIVDLLESSDAALIDLEQGKRFSYRRGISSLSICNYSEEGEGERQNGFYIKWDKALDHAGERALQWQSHIGCPIVARDKTLGYIIVRTSLDERKFEFADYNIVTHISNIVAGFMQNKEQFGSE